MNLDLLLQAAAAPAEEAYSSEIAAAESLASQLSWKHHSRKRRIDDEDPASSTEEEEAAQTGLSLLSRSAPETSSKVGRARDDVVFLSAEKRPTSKLPKTDDDFLKSLSGSTADARQRRRALSQDSSTTEKAVNAAPATAAAKGKKLFPLENLIQAADEKEPRALSLDGGGTLAATSGTPTSGGTSGGGKTWKKTQQQSTTAGSGFSSSSSSDAAAAAAEVPQGPGGEEGLLSELRRSCLVDGVPQPMSLEAPSRPLLYEELINFPRSRGKAHARRCVMCGHLASGEAATCSIPLQNKDVCKRCDTGIWRHRATAEYFKWCKGCKKFLHVCAFSEKLSKCTTKYSKQPSKCDRCRERGRQSYQSKRLDGTSSSNSAAQNAAAQTSSSSPSSPSSPPPVLAAAAASAAAAPIMASAQPSGGLHQLASQATEVIVVNSSSSAVSSPTSSSSGAAAKKPGGGPSPRPPVAPVSVSSSSEEHEDNAKDVLGT